MNNIIKHFKTITLHKWYVMIECFKFRLYWQGIIHDLSKYSITEFFISAKYFSGTKSPIENEKIEKGYSIAWLNHKAKNKHHWQYWTDFVDGNIITIPIPEKYIKEMFCDLIGASKAYTKEKFTKKEPLNYFINNSDKWIIDINSKEYLKNLLIKYSEGE
jgi:hypothetical protein